MNLPLHFCPRSLALFISLFLFLWRVISCSFKGLTVKMENNVRFIITGLCFTLFLLSSHIFYFSFFNFLSVKGLLELLPCVRWCSSEASLLLMMQPIKMNQGRPGSSVGRAGGQCTEAESSPQWLWVLIPPFSPLLHVISSLSPPFNVQFEAVLSVKAQKAQNIKNE